MILLPVLLPLLAPLPDVADWPAFADSSDALRRLATRYRLVILSNVDDQSFAGSYWWRARHGYGHQHTHSW